MAINTNLIGLGMAPALAGQVGHAYTSGVAGTGTTQSGANPLTTSVTLGAPTSGQTAYALPVSGTLLKEIYFFNGAAGATTALIYPPTGGASLNGSTSAAVSVAQNKGCLFMCLSGAGSNSAVWAAINSA